MRIGTRLLLFLVAPIVVVIIVFGIADQRRSRRMLRSELEREGRAVTLAMSQAVEDAVANAQFSDVRRLVDRITGYERILGVRVFDANGRLIYQSSTLDDHPLIHAQVLREVLAERVRRQTYRLIAGEPVVTFFEPLHGPADEPLGAIQVIQLEAFIEDDARTSRNAVALLIAIVVLAIASIVFLVAHFSISRPVAALVSNIRSVGYGDFRSRVPRVHGGELGHLAQEFNRMCERLEATHVELVNEQEERRRIEARLQRSEHLASLGRLSAGLAHEIGTPLNVIGGRTEKVLRAVAGNGEAERNLRIVAEQIERITRIVRGMLDFARAGEPRLAPADLGLVARRVFEFVEPNCTERQVRQALDLPDDLARARADAEQVYQVLLNLVLNSLDAMPGGGVLGVTARSVTRAHPELGGASANFVAMTVTDTGEGIERRHAAQVFEPFFTTKEVGKGTGLGLAVSYGIARAHGGWIELDSGPGMGTRVTVYFPVEEASG